MASNHTLIERGTKMRKSIILLSVLTTCFVVNDVIESRAWGPPSPPSLPAPPLPPAPPVPEFKIDSTTFLNHLGNKIEIPRNADCGYNMDWLRIRGANVNLAKDITVGGEPIEWKRQISAGDCGFNNCVGIVITTHPWTRTGERPVTLKAIDGRVLKTSFHVTASGNRCDYPATQNTGARTSPPPRVSSSTGGSGSSSSTIAPLPTATAVVTRSKGCQYGNLSMSGQENFVTRTAQMIKVSVAFNANSPCWCPSSSGGVCTPPNPGSRSWIIRRSDGIAIAIPWKAGDSTVANVPAGSWKIELNEGSVPPGNYSVIYNP